MPYEIVRAIARGVVDFLAIIDRGGWFTPLRDPDYFVATMTLLAGGADLAGGDRLFRRRAATGGVPAWAAGVKAA